MKTTTTRKAVRRGGGPHTLVVLFSFFLFLIFIPLTVYNMFWLQSIRDGHKEDLVFVQQTKEAKDTNVDSGLEKDLFLFQNEGGYRETLGEENDPVLELRQKLKDATRYKYTVDNSFEEERGIFKDEKKYDNVANEEDDFTPEPRNLIYSASSFSEEVGIDRDFEHVLENMWNDNSDDYKYVDDSFDSGVEDINEHSEFHRVLRGVSQRSIWSSREMEGVVRVAVVGTKDIIKRDLKVVKESYVNAGFTVRTAADLNPSVAYGRKPSSVRSIRRSDWDVLVCLSLKTQKCLDEIDFSRFAATNMKRVNRLLGLRDVLWSKNNFCDTITNSLGASQLVGEFTFPCWVLPRDRERLEEVARRKGNRGSSWIVKPLSQGGGKGIFVVDGFDGIVNSAKLSKGKHVVQPYLGNPFLINDRKWDLRTYVLVTSTVPVRAYVYSRGLVRFASETYSSSASKGGKKTQFLTNTSVNRKAGHNMTSLTWSFRELEDYFENNLGSGSYKTLFKNIQRSVAVMLLSSESSFSNRFKRVPKEGFKCESCYHLLGVDLIVDSNLHPRVIEINGEPSMKLSGLKGKPNHYDTTKRFMNADLVRLVFNALPDIAKVSNPEIKLALKRCQRKHPEAFRQKRSNTQSLARSSLRSKRKALGGRREWYVFAILVQR